MLYRILWFSVIHQQESAIGTPMSLPSRTALPSPSPSHLSGLSQSPCLSSLSHTAHSHWLSVLHMVLYISILLSPYISFSLLSSHLVHRSVLYVCFSIVSLKINSSVPSLQSPYICVSIQYLYFSFYFTLYNGLQSEKYILYQNKNIFLKLQAH